MQLTVIGTGFVGVVTAAVFADKGHTVYGLDIDKHKIESLKKSKVPFFEPGLSELLKQAQKKGDLNFTTNYKEAIPGSQVIFIGVGTPTAADGGADLRFIEAAVSETARHLSPGAIVIVKSTVPPGSFKKIEKIMSKETDVPFTLASMPEFLREGTAVHDTQHPDRIVIGSDDPNTIEKLRKLHQSFAAPIEVVSVESAQMGKYAANAYLANRITYINHIADLCEKNGADVMEVIRVIGRDRRIGDHYWYPGPGYGGSCFPKDVKELAHYSRTVGLENNLFNALTEWNEGRIPTLMQQFEDKIGGWKGKKVAVLGLAFKPHTDDIREAPALKIIPTLLAAGARVRGYDPKAIAATQQVLAETENLKYYDAITDVVKDADVVMAVIEWPEIMEFDYGILSDQKAWFIDWRNQFKPAELKRLQLRYLGIGRSSHD